jgi:hypothetical protein
MIEKSRCVFLALVCCRHARPNLFHPSIPRIHCKSQAPAKIELADSIIHSELQLQVRKLSHTYPDWRFIDQMLLSVEMSVESTWHWTYVLMPLLSPSPSLAFLICIRRCPAGIHSRAVEDVDTRFGIVGRSQWNQGSII